MDLRESETSDVSGHVTLNSLLIKSIQNGSKQRSDRTLQVTLGESIQKNYPTSISFVEDFHARRFRLPEKGRVSRILVERFSSRYVELRKLNDLHCYSSKTLKDSLNMTKEERSRSFSNPWRSWGIGSNGRYLTANFMVYPKTDHECSLLDIIMIEVPPQYYLSKQRLTDLSNSPTKSKEEPQVESLG